MSINKDVDYQKLNEIFKPVERVLGIDLEKLRRMDERERVGLWNQIKTSNNTFENEMASDLLNDMREKLRTDFSLATLLLAAAADANGEDSPVKTGFNTKELNLVQDFEKFNVFDILSTEEIVERTARKEDIYDLIVEFWQGQYANLDVLLDDSDIQRDVKLAFNKLYHKRLDKIVEGVKAYVEKYGPLFPIRQIEKRIWDNIKESERQRKTVVDELDRQIDEITSKLRPLGEFDEQSELFKQQLSGIERGIVTGKNLENLSSLESQKDDILNHYLGLEKELAFQVDTINQRRNELETREVELEKAKQEYQEQMQEEKQRLVESELNEIETLKERLFSQERAIEDEKTDLQIKREEIDSRLREITDVLQGKPIRFITKEDAKLCELNFIARFETKMETLPMKIQSPIENRTYDIKSWKKGAHLKFAEGVSPDTPANARSRYSVFERKHGLFGESVNKVVIEAVSVNHLEEFEKYGYDTRRINLADFLSIITRFINNAELGEYLHVIGIASPTGWDDRVRKEIESTDFAHNYVSRHVSICLVDSVTGEVVHNPTDNRISNFVEFFQPHFDQEKVVKVKKAIRNKLNLKDHASFEEIMEETNETRTILNKAFYDLETEGMGRLRYIDQVGLVLEVKTKL